MSSLPGSSATTAAGDSSGAAGASSSNFQSGAAISGTDSCRDAGASTWVGKAPPKSDPTVLASMFLLSTFVGSASKTTAGALPSDFGTGGIPGSACAYSNTPPSRTACADRTSGIGSGSAVGLRAIWPIQSRITRCAPSARSSKSSLAPRSCASHKLKHCSTAQAPSPTVLKPTMRLDPLSVWNARRTVVSVA